MTPTELLELETQLVGEGEGLGLGEAPRVLIVLFDSVTGSDLRIEKVVPATAIIVITIITA